VKSQFIVTLIAVFALIAQPLYSLVNHQDAHAIGTVTVDTTDMSSWDMSNSRATGHYAIVANGLHIWTEGATSTDKVAGYHAASYPLSDLSGQTIAGSLDYQASAGGAPGLQVKVDLDNNGSFDGTLVGESVYGNNWWLADSTDTTIQSEAPHIGGGNGSPWYGTLSEWSSAFPSAHVQAIGFSLGSGVFGDGVIKRMTFGDTNYTFTATPLSAPANLSISRAGSNVTGGTINNFSENVVLNFDAVAGADKYITHVVYPGGSADASNSYHNTWLVKNGAPSQGQFGAHGDGVYTYTVKAHDPTTGLWSNWSAPASLTYDTTAPDVTAATANGRQLDLNGVTTVNTTSGVTLAAVCTDAFSSTSKTWLTYGQWTPTSDNRVSGDNTIFIPASEFTDGQTYSFTVDCSDVYNYASMNHKTYTVQFKADNTAPTMDLRYGQSGAIIADGSVINNTGKNIRIDKDNTDTIHVTKPSGSTWVGGKKDASYAGGKLSMDFLFTQDGTYTFYTEDEAGNVSADYKITIDTNMPQLSVDAPTDLVTNAGTLDVTGTITDTNLSEYRYQILDHNKQNTLGSIGYSRHGGSNEVTSDGTLFTADISNLSDGTYYISVWATDKAGNATNVLGNRLAAPYIMKFTVDRTAPNVAPRWGTTPADGATVSNKLMNPSHAIQFAANITDLLGNVESAKIHFVDSNNVDKSFNLLQHTAGGHYEDWYNYINLNNLATGTYKIWFEGTDNAGNVGYYNYDSTTNTVGNSYGVYVDNTAPDIALSGSQVSGVYTGAVAYSVSDGDSVDTVEVDGVPVSTSGTVSADGTHTITATDKVGNSASKQFTIDTTAPALTVGTPHQNTDGTYTISGTTDGTAQSVMVTIDNGVAMPATLKPNDTWTYTTTTALGGGTDHEVVVTASDAYGNSVTSAPVDFSVPPVNSSTVSRSSRITRIAPLASANTLAATTNPSTASQSTNADNKDDSGKVLGTKDSDTPLKDTAAITPSTQGWKLWGIAWYWWLLLVAVVAGIWWLLAARRRRQDNDPVSGL